MKKHLENTETTGTSDEHIYCENVLNEINVFLGRVLAWEYRWVPWLAESSGEEKLVEDGCRGGGDDRYGFTFPAAFGDFSATRKVHQYEEVN